QRGRRAPRRRGVKLPVEGLAVELHPGAEQDEGREENLMLCVERAMAGQVNLPNDGGLTSELVGTTVRVPCSALRSADVQWPGPGFGLEEVQAIRDLGSLVEVSCSAGHFWLPKGIYLYALSGGYAPLEETHGRLQGEPVPVVQTDPIESAVRLGTRFYREGRWWVVTQVSVAGWVRATQLEKLEPEQMEGGEASGGEEGELDGEAGESKEATMFLWQQEYFVPGEWVGERPGSSFRVLHVGTHGNTAVVERRGAYYDVPALVMSRAPQAQRLEDIRAEVGRDLGFAELGAAQPGPTVDGEGTMVLSRAEAAEALAASPLWDVTQWPGPQEFKQLQHEALAAANESRGEDTMVEHVIDGVVYVEVDLLLKVYVPPSLVDSLVLSYHERLAHARAGRVLETLRCGFFWPQMHADVRRVIGECKLCPLMGGEERAKPPLLVTPAPAYPFQVVHADTYTAGGKHVLVFRDALSRYVVLVEVVDASAGEAARALEYFVTRCGAPEVLVSDRGTEFLAEVVGLCGILQVHQHRITVRSPHENGMVERSMKELTKGLRAYLAEGFPFASALRYYECAVNAAVGSTGQSPHFVATGRELRFPGVDGLVAAEGMLSRRVEAIEAAVRHVGIVTMADRRRRSVRYHSGELRRYEVGDLVYVRRECARGVKTSLRWMGPYPVVAALPDGVTYLVHVGTTDVPQRWHALNLKKVPQVV
ncbi:MAG: integrase, partial [Bacteroidota bacterium]